MICNFKPCKEEVKKHNKGAVSYCCREHRILSGGVVYLPRGRWTLSTAGTERAKRMNLYDTICKYPDFISLETNTMSEEVRGLEDTQEEAQDDSQEESSEEESSEEEE